jgi:hypothetical protein
VKKANFSFRSSCALGIVSLFVYFLAASAPHRVHHLLEDLQFPADPEHGFQTASQLTTSEHNDAYGDTNQANAREQAGSSEQDRHHDTAPMTDCVLQSAANNSHLSPSQPLALTYQKILLMPPAGMTAISFINFSPAPCSQRAPPKL